MSSFRLDDAAAVQIEDIFIYSATVWGEDQASAYVFGLYDVLDDIAARRVPWRRVPAIFPVEGFMRRYRSHVVYWRVLEEEAIGVVAVLHRRMLQSDRLLKLFQEES